MQLTVVLCAFLSASGALADNSDLVKQKVARWVAADAKVAMLTTAAIAQGTATPTRRNQTTIYPQVAGSPPTMPTSEPGRGGEPGKPGEPGRPGESGRPGEPGRNGTGSSGSSGSGSSGGSGANGPLSMNPLPAGINTATLTQPVIAPLSTGAGGASPPPPGGPAAGEPGRPGNETGNAAPTAAPAQNGGALTTATLAAESSGAAISGPAKQPGNAAGHLESSTLLSVCLVGLLVVMQL